MIRTASERYINAMEVIMEWLKSILEKHIGADGKMDVDGAIKEINKKAPDNIVPKDKYNTLSEAKKQLEIDIKTRDAQLEELKKAGSVEDLQNKLQVSQAANKKAKEEYEEKIANMKYDVAIEKALSGAIHPDLMSSKIDKTKLSIKEDTIIGLDVQVKALKESYKDMFKQDKKGTTPNNPEGQTTVITKEQFSKMSYKDKVSLFNENREVYNQLTGGK